MRTIPVVNLCALFAVTAQAQVVPASARVAVHVSTAAGPAPAVIVASGKATVLTDALGLAVLTLEPGTVVIRARRIGLAPDSISLRISAGADTSIVLLMREQAAVIAPIIVSSTRTERRVEEEPLRVEVLSGEDVGEKAQMHPADIRTLLTEMSGVRVQPTSPSLGGAALRIQGLRGHYTQILTDGLPLYGAQAGSFGLLQIPPLDLRQAEVIKGAASALYGSNAMGGVVNLVSRRAPDSSEAIVNATSRGGADVVGFVVHELDATRGMTFIAGAHTQRAADVDGDGWSDLAGVRRIEIRPKLFVAGASGRALMATLGAFAEDRGGGATVTNGASAFAESLSTRHLDAGMTARMRVSNALSFATRIAANIQTRVRRFGAQREGEHAATIFAEVTSTYAEGAQTLLLGAAEQGERYRNADAARFNESRSTTGIFAQQTWSPQGWLSEQLNARCDVSSAYGTICTPRLSILTRASPSLSLRLSAASGWNAPSALTEETEVFGLSRVDGPLAVSTERARSASLDVSSTHGPLEVNGTLFASRVVDPVGLRRVVGDTSGRVVFVNAGGPALAHGGEIFAVYHEEPFMVTAFYALTRTRETSAESGRLRESAYVPRETAGFDMAFEEDESGTRIGLEVFFTGPQALEDNPYRAIAPAYATIGLLASQRLGRAAVYVNLENLGNVRQTRYDPLLRAIPGDGGRRTVDEWAPLEGRSLNLGFRMQL